MDILYASNDGYARHLGVSLYSLLEHNRQAERIMVYLLSVGMSEENQTRLSEIARQFGRKLVVVEMGNLKERFSGPIDTRGFDISAMTRLFAAEVLPGNVEKILYLDCDTVILDDLEPLWRLDLGETLVGMVMEPTVYEEMKASIDLTKDDPYYNSGVLLMNLKGWREERVAEKLLGYYAAKGGKLFACDQDTINGALRGRIMTLPPKYNFFTNYRYFRYETLTGLNRSYQTVGKEAFELARRHPAVIHYAGDERPWIAGNRNYYRRYYDIYLSRTPWKGTPKEAGKELYMMLYWGMNQITRLCPPARIWISRHFGMKVIDSRKRK